MQASRLFKIVYYLLDKGKMTAPELAEMFEVSVRTIYRDIDALSSAGIPIYATNGRNGGIQLLDNFILNKLTLSKQEQEEILLGLQSLNAVQYPATDDILTKLGALFKSNSENWIEVDFSRWGSVVEREKNLFGLIKQAILEKRQIQFDYLNSSGGMSQRWIEPVKLIYKDKAWYLYGFCITRDDWRLFRISRIKNIQLTAKRFERMLEETADIWAAPENYGRLVELELLFSLQVGYRLYDLLNEDVIKEEQGRIKVSMVLPENEWLYGFLMSFGEAVTILKPACVKEQLIKRYKKALQHQSKE